jgi:hypothetical protein
VDTAISENFSFSSPQLIDVAYQLNQLEELLEKYLQLHHYVNSSLYRYETYRTKQKMIKRRNKLNQTYFEATEAFNSLAARDALETLAITLNSLLRVPEEGIKSAFVSTIFRFPPL